MNRNLLFFVSMFLNEFGIMTSFLDDLVPKERLCSAVDVVRYSSVSHLSVYLLALFSLSSLSVSLYLVSLIV